MSIIRYIFICAITIFCFMLNLYAVNFNEKHHKLAPKSEFKDLYDAFQVHNGKPLLFANNDLQNNPELKKYNDDIYISHKNGSFYPSTEILSSSNVFEPIKDLKNYFKSELTSNISIINLSKQNSKIAYISPKNLGSGVIVPVSDNINLYTDIALACLPLIMQLEDKDGNAFIFLSHVHKYFPHIQINYFISQLEKQHMTPSEIILSPNEEVFKNNTDFALRYKTALNDIKNQLTSFLGKKPILIERPAKMLSDAFVSSDGWVIHSYLQYNSSKKQNDTSLSNKQVLFHGSWNHLNIHNTTQLLEDHNIRSYSSIYIAA